MMKLLPSKLILSYQHYVTKHGIGMRYRQLAQVWTIPVYHCTELFGRTCSPFSRWCWKVSPYNITQCRIPRCFLSNPSLNVHIQEFYRAQGEVSDVLKIIPSTRCSRWALLPRALSENQRCWPHLRACQKCRISSSSQTYWIQVCTLTRFPVGEALI